MLTAMRSACTDITQLCTVTAAQQFAHETALRALTPLHGLCRLAEPYARRLTLRAPTFFFYLAIRFRYGLGSIPGSGAYPALYPMAPSRGKLRQTPTEMNSHLQPGLGLIALSAAEDHGITNDAEYKAAPVRDVRKAKRQCMDF
jgi:hypothetical protein